MIASLPPVRQICVAKTTGPCSAVHPTSGGPSRIAGASIDL